MHTYFSSTILQLAENERVKLMDEVEKLQEGATDTPLPTLSIDTPLPTLTDTYTHLHLQK